MLRPNGKRRMPLMIKNFQPFSNRDELLENFPDGIRFDESYFSKASIKDAHSIEITFVVDLKNHQDLKRYFESSLAELKISAKFKKLLINIQCYLNGGMDDGVFDEEKIICRSSTSESSPYLEIFFIPGSLVFNIAPVYPL